MNVRKNNYDLLRIICMLGVIIVHVSASYLNQAAESIASGR